MVQWSRNYQDVCLKAQKQYKNYVANITETCDPDNELQLITKGGECLLKFEITVLLFFN